MNVRSRQDAIVRRLRRSGTSTIGQLADDVGASRRTILRDISSLRDQGYIIYSEPGRGGGLRLDPSSIQTTARLSIAEVFALLISVASVRAAGAFPFSDLADSGLAKIEKGLPTEMVRGFRQFLECLYVGELSPLVDISDLGKMDPALLPAFEEGFLKKNKLRFRYRDAKGKQSNRFIEPQAMLILPPLWYLVAWDPDKEDFRHFRMDRIRKPKCVPGTSFNRRYVPFKENVRSYKGSEKG